jgi:predicted phosphodiesterase
MNRTGTTGGIISDTHGLLRPEAATALEGADLIVHAGDVGKPAVLDLDPKAAGFAAVTSGHTHRPGAEVRDSVLYLNPGSAGPRRFSLPVEIARLQIVGQRLAHEIVELRV